MLGDVTASERSCGDGWGNAEMNTLLDQLEGSASTSTCLAFGSVSGEEIRFARIWSDSATSASWFSALLPDGAPVAMVLNASRACITALLGAWRAGLTVLSLPDPTRMAGATYSALLKQISDSHGDLYLLTERTRVDALPEMTAVHPVDFETAAFGGSGRRRESVGSFIQYTSGSTRSPAGVVLDLAAMASGI
jgi:acyl-CoA synthetase (AMP-forming)/AMP-acid ligase II